RCCLYLTLRIRFTVSFSHLVFTHRIFFFFFYAFGPLRDLHSFPTRRSSDLFVFTRPGDTATQQVARELGAVWAGGSDEMPPEKLDRKSTRLNSSHEWISYAVFCLKKKKKMRASAPACARDNRHHTNPAKSIR